MAFSQENTYLPPGRAIQKGMAFFTKAILFSVAIVFLSRVYFLFSNHFQSLPFPGLLHSLAGGFFYDLATTGVFFLVFLFLQTILAFTQSNVVKKISTWWFVFYISFILVVNVFSSFYYPYLNRHLYKADIPLLASHYTIIAKLDKVTLLGIIAAVLGIIAAAYLSFKFFRKISAGLYSSRISAKAYIISIAFFVCICFAGIRGLRSLPLSPASVSQYASSESSAVALNSTYTLLFSFTKNYSRLEKKNYYPEVVANDEVPTIHDLGSGRNFNRKNVVLFIIEHGSNEYFDTGYSDRPQMPFLDSLIRESIYYNNCYANASTTSAGIEALTGGMPHFTDNVLAASMYATNKVKALGQVLKDSGYATRFFYSSNDVGNGNSKIAGFYGIDHYITGKGQFKDGDYDGVIGVYDGKFYPYVAEEIKKVPQPFFIATENVSTHNPFNLIPDDYLKRYGNPDREANAAFRYFDDALAAFFNKIKNEPWFNNTIFVFAGDHKSRSLQLKEAGTTKRNKVAFFIYEPGLKNKEAGVSNILCQQMDAGISILDRLGYNGKYFSFGNSIYSDKERFVYFKGANISEVKDSAYSLSYHEGGDKVISFAAYNQLHSAMDSIQRKEVLLKKLKSFIQVFNNHIIDNSLTPR